MFFSFLLSPVSSLAARLRRSRPGSVLIIVIVLLLLLAILGAAFISTTRTDRVASQQNVLNTDVDSTLTGISKICEGVLVDDLNDTFGNLRGNTGLANNTVPNRSYYQGTAGTTPTLAPNVPAAPGGYNPGDIVNDQLNPSVFYYSPQAGAVITSGVLMAPSASQTTGWQLMNGHLPVTAGGADPWLADRIPDSPGTGSPMWEHITQSIQNISGVATSASILGTSFEDPLTGKTPNVTSPLVGGGSAAGGLLTPTSIALGSGFNIPAFQYGSAGAKFTALDADGDGIADSLPFRVPGLALDGLTWYAGVRIIDNNSAVNVNTAWSRDIDTFFGAAAPGGPPYFDNYWALFATSVGLRELVNTTDLTGAPPQLTALNTYRFNNASLVTKPVPNPSPQTAYDESWNSTNTPPAAVARADFNYVNLSDAFYNELGRRITNPGYLTYAAAPPVNGTRYQALPYSDMASLAYHFCLQNQSSMSQSVIETLLPISLDGATANPVSSTPYDPSNVNGWYTANFAYGSGNSTLPIRPLLVTRNPVSNYIQLLFQGNAVTPSPSEPLVTPANSAAGSTFMAPYGNVTSVHYKGVWSSSVSTPYAAGDIVLYPGVANGGSPNGPNFTFMATAIPGAIAPLGAGNAIQPPWQLQPWSQNPVKANVNTATFSELFRAFWCVMAGNPSNDTPFGLTTPNYNIYDNTLYNPTANTGNSQYEFRSPLRDPTAAVGTNKVSLLDAPNASGLVTNTNNMLLHAALAAVNTLALRDNSQNVISRTITLNNVQVDVSGVATPTQCEARVYSIAPNPVITEIYANTYADSSDPNGGGLANPKGYVAIELFNPYNYPLILHNWQVGYVNRSATGAYPNLTFGPTTGTTSIQPMVPDNNPTASLPAYASNASITGNTTDVIIPPQGFALLENYMPPTVTPPANVTPNTADDALYRPASSLLPAAGVYTGPIVGGTQLNNTVDVWVSGLSNVIADIAASGPNPPAGTAIGGEFHLLRPRRADGTFTTSNDPTNAYIEQTSAGVTNLYDLVPVDSYDFTNLVQTGPGAATYNVWSYLRGKGVGGSGQPPQLFKANYPGAYSTAFGLARFAGTAPMTAQPIPPVATVTWTPATASPLFGQYSAGSYPNNFPPIQTYSLGTGVNSHFPNAVVTPPNAVTAAPLQFPFGTFARNGDMLDIPFVGTYRIREIANIAVNPQQFVELNTLPMDCAMSAIDDGAAIATSVDPAQNIGRFVPMSASAAYQTRLHPIPPNPAIPDFYAWTRNIFNYLTAQSNTDNYLPDFDPNIEDVTVPANPNTAKYPAAPGPTQVYNRDPLSSDQVSQDNVGVEGLININTASWKVLSLLPMVTPAMEAAARRSAATYLTDNENLAKAIVVYRDGDGTALNPPHGPFMSIFDLNNVVATIGGTSYSFQTAAGTLTLTDPTKGPTSAQGLLSPADVNFGKDPASAAPSGIPTGVAEDYQYDCLTLTRISNLITTRSDTFTVYIVLQGWQNAGTANAQPMVTRRYAFIVDRSAINADPTSRYAKTLVVPNN